MNDAANLPDLLVTGALLPAAREALEGRFTLHDLGKAPDRDAFLDEVGGTIAGIAMTGGLRLDAALFDKLPNVRIAANFGVGYDMIDAAEAARRGIIVTNTPDVLTDEVADLTLGLLLATIRRIPQADQYLRAGRWLEKSFPFSPTLRGRTVGILGLGRIGKAVAQRLEGFNVDIAYSGRNRQEGVAYAYYPTPLALAEACDVVIVVVPGGGDTVQLVDAAVLKALGPDGILVNVARGSVVDETALTRALEDGTIAAAGLDVFANEPKVPADLIACDNTVLLPHIGSASHATRGAMAQLMVDNLTSWFDGKGPVTPVPETPWPKKG